MTKRMKFKQKQGWQHHADSDHMFSVQSKDDFGSIELTGSHREQA